jgi:hypothetical protein
MSGRKRKPWNFPHASASDRVEANTMASTRISLDIIDVEQPCPVSWDSMRGDERVRFCNECSLHVYDLSAMTRPQAEAMVNEWEPGKRMCVRFYRRADGTVITKDCGGGVRAAARRATRRAAAVCAAILCAMLSPLGLRGFVERSGTAPSVTAPQPAPEPVLFPGAMVVRMGDFACPPAPEPAHEFLGKRAMIQGGLAAPANPPASQPSTQPACE